MSSSFSRQPAPHVRCHPLPFWLPTPGTPPGLDPFEELEKFPVSVAPAIKNHTTLPNYHRRASSLLLVTLDTYTATCVATTMPKACRLRS